MANILIPTDMSEGSRKAVLFALDAYGPEEGRFTLLLSIGDVPRPTLVPEFVRYVKQEARGGLERFMAEVRDLFPGQTLNLDGKIEHGSVYAVVEDFVRDQPVDMVVMGTRGEGRSLSWGSNAEVMARNASVPVIVVPPEWEAGPVQKILYADDRRPVREQGTLLPLVQLARRYGADIEFVHVAEEVVVREPGTGVAGHGAVFNGINCTTASTVGSDITESLALLTDSGKYGMLAVLHRRLGWLDGLFHRSVAKRMAVSTTVPVLVLHE